MKFSVDISTNVSTNKIVCNVDAPSIDSLNFIDMLRTGTT
jgi:hypothetical protein